MNKFSVLALVALSAMAGIASSQNSTLTLGAEGGSTQGTLSNHADASHDGTKMDEALRELADLQMTRAELQMILAGENVTEAEKASAEARLATNDGEIKAQKSLILELQNGRRDGAAVTNSPVLTPAIVDVQAVPRSREEEGGGGDMFAMFSAAEQKELGVGNKGDKCKGFKIFFASQAAEKKCQVFDTETACEAGGCEYQCSFKVNNVCKQAKCQPSAATTQKIMGITIDEEKAQADMLAKIAGKTEEEGKKIMKDEMKKYLKPMVPVMNDLNTTMVEIAKFIKRCGGGKTKAACAADKVCELQLAFNASTDNFTQQCNVNKAKAVEETGCSGVARAVADLDALERKAVAAGAKKALAGKQKKQKGAKDAVEKYKKANPTATADTDTALKALETQAASADAEVIAASATVTTADADATAAEQKAAATPADSSTLRALPSIMAVVAATVAAAFA